MNKSDLILELAQKSQIPPKVAATVVDLFFGSMADALQEGDRVEIRGFGSFVSKRYGAYEGRNPKTGAKIIVPEKRLPFFKVGKELRRRVDGAQTSVRPNNVASVDGSASDEQV